MHIVIIYVVALIFRNRIPFLDNNLVFATFTLWMIWEFLKWLCLKDCVQYSTNENLTIEGPPGSGKTIGGVYAALRKRNIGILRYIAYYCLPFIRSIHPDWKYKPTIYSTFPIVIKYIKTTKSERKRMREEYKRFKSEDYKPGKVEMKQRQALELEGWKSTHGGDLAKECEVEYFEIKYKQWVERMELKDKLRRKKVRKKKPVFCKVLTPEILLRYAETDYNAIFVVDEAGSIFSQWEYDNPVIMEQVKDFNARGRHYRNVIWILIDQTITDIAKPLRCRNGMVYHQHNFRRAWGFMPFYKSDFIPMMAVEGESQMIIAEDAERADNHTIWGPLPYAWQRYRKRYDSRYLSELYKESAVETCEEFDGFKTRYVPNLSVSSKVEKSYRQNKRAYRRNYLYRKDFYLDLETGEFRERAEDDREDQ